MATPDLEPVITAAPSETNDDNFMESKPNLSMVSIMQLVIMQSVQWYLQLLMVNLSEGC